MENQSNPEDKPDLMGYEGQVKAAEEVILPNVSNAEDLQSLINKAVKEVTVDDNGKYVYPDNMDPVMKAAVAATKSYRDNQSGFTKSQQALKEAEAEAQALRKKLADVTSGNLELSNDERDELEDLKQSNPDAWRTRLNEIELESKQAIKQELDSVTEEVREKASAEYELERRYKYLDEFNEDRDVKITPELLDNDIPPRLTAKLADKTYTFEEFLDAVSDYLDKGKVVGNTKAEVTTDLNKANGSSAPGVGKSSEPELDYSQVTL